MDIFKSPVDVLSMASVILLLILTTNRSLFVSSDTGKEEDESADDIVSLPLLLTSNTNLDAIARATLHQYRLFNSLAALDEDLGFWMKPRSTAWFSRFILEEYDNRRWVQLFRFSKRSVFKLSQILASTLMKKDTKYRLAIPVQVRIACTLFKLCHGASLLICSELFAMGRSTVSTMLREVVYAINISLRNEVRWPSSDCLNDIARDFHQLCGLPGVLGAIDGTHIPISKPRSSAIDYYYFKSGGYTINCQAVVDSSKRFLDLYVGMPGSTNDSQMLRRSTLFSRGQRRTLWDSSFSFNGFAPYLLGDAGYPLLPWLMVPHRQQVHQAMAANLFNQHLSKGRGVIENAFALLKMSFRELHQKSELHVSFILDVVTCCVILHNVLQNQSHDQIEELLQVLRYEGGGLHQEDSTVLVENGIDPGGPSEEQAEGMQKRMDLGVFLSLQRL